MTPNPWQRRVRTSLLIVGTLILAFYSLMPLYWMVSVSITPEQQFFAREIRLLPHDLTLANYRTLFNLLEFTSHFRNSLIVASGTTLFSLTLVIPAAYSFARFRFYGRNPLVTGLLLVYMIPPVVLLLPLLVIFKTFQLLNTFHGLILAEATATIPFAIWLLVNYFAALPRELEDAALVDGCTPVGALVRIVLPLAVPGIVATGLFIFIVTWNEFLYAFTFASREAVKTLPPMMRSLFGGESGIFWGTIMAGATLTSLPVALLFLFFQRYLIGGLATGAVKG